MAKKLREMVDVEHYTLKSSSSHKPLTMPLGSPPMEREKQMSFSETKFYKQLKILKEYFADLGNRIYKSREII